MPKESRANSHKRPVGELSLPLLNRLNSRLVDDHFVIPSLDKPASEMLELFAGLNEEVVARRNLDGDSLSGVACPDVQAGVAGTAMNGKEVEICMEAGEDGVLFAVLFQV